jgi:hypothetical protein
VLCKPIATLDLATPPNTKFVLLLLLSQPFWFYCNIFGALKKGPNLVVEGALVGWAGFGQQARSEAAAC